MRPWAPGRQLAQRWEGCSPTLSHKWKHMPVCNSALALQEKNIPLFFAFSSFVLHLFDDSLCHGDLTPTAASVTFTYSTLNIASREDCRALSPSFTLCYSVYVWVGTSMYLRWSQCAGSSAWFPSSPANSCQAGKVGQCLSQLGQKEYVLC